MKGLRTRIWEEYRATMDETNNTADALELAELNGKASGLIWAYSECLKEYP